MTAKTQICEVHHLGLIPYLQAWEMQNRLAEQVAARERPPTLLLLEHPHTYTLGRRGDAAHLLFKQKELDDRRIEVHWVDRGGDITYHGPGQLVGYPIFPLADRGWQGDRLPQTDYVGYVRNLEKALIITLSHFGLLAGQISGLTGVWIQPDVASRCPRCDPQLRQAHSKIASIGVKVDVHGVTRHGFALNIAPEMEYWQGIVPCGLDGVLMASMSSLLDPVPGMNEVMDALENAFGEVFGYKMVDVK